MSIIFFCPDLREPNQSFCGLREVCVMNNRQVRRTVAPNRTDSTTMVLDDSTEGFKNG